MGEYLGLRLRPLAMDEQGIVPEAFGAACADSKPKALYCTPTLHNPTTATMGAERRREIAAIAERYGVAIIEDDAYGMLPDQPCAPLAALAPDLTYYISSLSKSLSPALRIAYLVVPNARIAARLTANIRASTSIASPLTSAIATRWIETGSADNVLRAIRQETRERHRLLRSHLPLAQSTPEAFHAWLPLRSTWDRHAFAAKLRSVGIGVVASDAFAVGAAPEAVRLGLGGVATREELEASLTVIADVLDQSPSFGSMVV
jgi:DNA-binding transcriptional MocR family regulator